jgi:predicted nucleic acid-binding Zn ribbon protein
MFYKAPKKGNGGRSAESNSLKEVIDALFRTYKLEKKFSEVTIINSWTELVGKLIASKTTDLYIRKKVLYVVIDSPPLKNQLFMSRTRLLELIAETYGPGLIVEVVVR